MPRYIPHEQCKQLREAAKNGDELARRILRAQLDDKEDFSADLEEYFKPKVEPVEEVAEAPQQEVVQPETQVITGEQTSTA